MHHLLCILRHDPERVAVWHIAAIAVPERIIRTLFHPVCIPHKLSVGRICRIVDRQRRGFILCLQAVDPLLHLFAFLCCLRIGKLLAGDLKRLLKPRPRLNLNDLCPVAQRCIAHKHRTHPVTVVLREPALCHPQQREPVGLRNIHRRIGMYLYPQ